MAYCITSQWSTAAPQMKLTVTESTATTITSTLSWKLEYIASSAANTSSNRPYTVYINNHEVKSGDYNINGKKGTYTVASGEVTLDKTTSNKNIPFDLSVSFNLTWNGKYAGKLTASGNILIPMKDNYKITYNANGGSGAPSSQTKWAHTNIKLSSSRPSRTGYIFKGWATSSSGSVAYQPGATYTRNAPLNLYAVWEIITYTITYNANGGSGAPGSQTKKYGQNVNISSDIPTKKDYKFNGWGTNESSTTVAYNPGDQYTLNSSIVLYAIWELDYISPRIMNFTADRCTSDGTSSEEGTYAHVKFDWATDKNINSITIEYKLKTDEEYISENIPITEISTSGTIDKIIGGELSNEFVYSIRVTVSDIQGSSSLTRDLPSMRYLLDFTKDGVAIGKPAEKGNLLDINYPTLIRELITSQKGFFVSHSFGTKNADGYIKICRIIIESSYSDSPIKISIIQRKINASIDIYIKFSSVDTNDPEIDSFGYIGTSECNIYINKATTSTWDIYIKKMNPYDDIGIIGYYTNFEYWNPNLEWVDEQLESVPEDSILATDLLKDKISNSNVINNYRFQKEWIGFYGNQNDAINSSNRKGFIGYNNTETLVLNNKDLDMIQMRNDHSLFLGGTRRKANENTTVWGYRIDLNGSSGGVYANQSIQNSSDSRLKKNIEDISDTFVSVWNEIFPKMFVWNELSDTNNTKIQFGIIAQDAVEAFEKYGLDYKKYGFVSSIIKEDPESGSKVEYYTVSYDHYHMLTALVVKKQQEKLDNLESKINELTNYIKNQGAN